MKQICLNEVHVENMNILSLGNVETLNSRKMDFMLFYKTQK